MTKKYKPDPKPNRNGEMQKIRLTEEELADIRKKLSPYIHNSLIRQLYRRLMPN